ncbi:MAG: diacylglycerol/lipid kinase family protein [Pyrinomonadaceae bacterium]
MLPLVIVNPRSAAGATREKWSAIASDLRTHFGPFNVAFTKGPGDGIELAKRAVASGRRLVLACGGDGTINEVANGILQTGEDVEFGVLPSGTGGDFRRTIGMPNGIRECARALREGRTRTIDVGRVTFCGHDGEQASRFFVNVSSFGLAASILDRVKTTTSLKWLPVDRVRGRASFALSTLQEVLDLDPVTVRVSIDGEAAQNLRTVNFCIANARYFGGGMMIAPEAKLGDGLLNVVNIGDIAAAKVLLNAHTLYRGTHGSLSEVNERLAKRIEVSSADPNVEIRLETDGELPGRLPAIYEVVPSALKIRVPAPANE